jgi:hypothetical protein
VRAPRRTSDAVRRLVGARCQTPPIWAELSRRLQSGRDRLACISADATRKTQHYYPRHSAHKLFWPEQTGKSGKGHFRGISQNTLTAHILLPVPGSRERRRSFLGMQRLCSRVAPCTTPTTRECSLMHAFCSEILIRE